MKTIDQDKSLSIAANKYWRLLPDIQYALGNFADDCRVQGAPSLDWDIDLSNGKAFAVNHSRPHPAAPPGGAHKFRRTLE